MNSSTPAVCKARTGIPGLDDVLHGGLTRGGMFLTEGDPATGKTTLGRIQA
jgi:circadian clock protein KaiC